MFQFRCGRYLAAILLALCAALPSFAQAQTFPTKPVKLIVGFPPGGSSDVVGRLIAEGAADALGQSVVIENMPGAGGSIGTARAAKSPADGYTVVLCTIGTCAINPSVYANVGYDLQRDFVPVFLVGGVMNVFTVNPAFNVKTIAELVSYAKANPGKLPVAIGGVGSSNHLTPVWFASVAGLEMLWVPYKGSGDSITALISGQVQMFVDNEPSILPQINAGKARALAVTGPKRSRYLPDVPTMEEAGYKGFIVEPWYGVMAPAGTPGAVVEKLNAAFNAGLKNPRVQKRLEEAGLRIVGGAPERLGEQIRSESERWAKVVKANKIKVE
jgi:tripartite-type tricarboxylate transporter receptor subunit TctC